MSIKRYTGSTFLEVSSRKRWNGSAWVALTVGKRWNGTAWVDLWNNSQGGGSGDSSGGESSSGDLFKDLKSTVSSPTVHFSCGYEVTNARVNLTFKGWLTSSASKLGSGIKLTVFARMGGGEWQSAVIKSTSAVWNDSSKHSASLTLDGEISGKTKIELYVTRSGSTYGGSAGTVASAKSPKTYYIN